MLKYFLVKMHLIFHKVGPKKPEGLEKMINFFWWRINSTKNNKISEKLIEISEKNKTSEKMSNYSSKKDQISEQNNQTFEIINKTSKKRPKSSK